jgi:hypothetical protein
VVPLIFILVALILFVGFLALTWYEERQGRRLIAPSTRGKLDATVSRVSFVLEHVDLQAFIREEIRRALHKTGQAIVTLSLSLVRALERLLTRLVRYMRMQHTEGAEAHGADTRPFVKTLSAFKDRLKKTKRSDDSPVE